MGHKLSDLSTEELFRLLEHNPEAEESAQRFEEARKELRELAGKPKVEETKPA